MTIEKQPDLFVVVAKGMSLICKDDFIGEKSKDRAYIFLDLDAAKGLANAYTRNFGVPCEVMELISVL